MSRLQRRDFLRMVGWAGGAVAGGATDWALGAASAPASQPAMPDLKDLPTRTLGRTGLEVPMLSFGSAAMGHAFYEQQPFEEVVHAALEVGVRYIDTAPLYDVAEERLGPILARHRERIILAGKTRQDHREGVLQEIEGSLRRLRTDHLDIGHIHNLGDFETDKVLGPGGSLEGLIEARRRGLIRFIGCTGHLKPERFLPVLQTGLIDVLMVAMNFVDRYTYGFEDKVLPEARKQKCGIIAMKVYGGVSGGWDGYHKKRPGRLVQGNDRQDAFDYALGLPGVATCVVGIKSLEELRLAIEAVRGLRPIEGDRLTAVQERGRALAAEWGPHLGT